MAAVESRTESSAASGSAAAAAVGVAADALAPKGLPCSQCGFPVEPDDRFCPACGAAAAGAAEVVEATVVTSPDHPQKHFRCSGCGSQMTADPDQRSYTCPFCDSTYVVEFSPQETSRQRPEFVIGFAVTKEQAQEKFRTWLHDNSWFRPGDLRARSIVEKQQGIYLPFWSFAMLAESSWEAEIGEYWYRTETYTTRDANGKTVTRTRQVRETEWWPLGGRHHAYHHGYLVSGSQGLPQAEAERILPFNLPALKRYQPYFLAGWLCEEYSVDRDTALQISTTEFQRREQFQVAAFLPGDTHQNLQVRTQFSRVTSDLCLLPVYVLSYRYRDRLFRFLVNGQTGKIAGDKPWSGRRILAAIVVVVILVGAVIALIAAFAPR